MHTKPQDLSESQPDNQPKVNPLMIDQYICSICLCLMNYPKTLTCKHSFCSSCLSHSYLEHQACPLCRGIISENPSQIPVSLELFQEIKKYSKSCCNNLYSMTSLHTGETDEAAGTRVGCIRSQLNNLIFPSDDNLDRTNIESQAAASHGQSSASANSQLQSAQCLLRYTKRTLVSSFLVTALLFIASVFLKTGRPCCPLLSYVRIRA